ncbi:MAG: ABC transporter ATP-binding protein [Chloroflexota bacterium]
MEASGLTRPRVVEVQGLTKSFGSNLALRGIDLEVNQGESVVIFGPNGAGKTTLIKILATITGFSSGKVLVDNLDVKHQAEAVRRRIGLVSHHTFLYPNLTAAENLEFYARLYQVPRRRERINHVAGLVGMTSRLHDRVGTLSRGMQQRVAIARALLHRPEIMLLDEPETGLDQQAIVLLWEAIRCDSQQPRTILFTSHNLERGLELGHRLLILARGKITYQGDGRAIDLPTLKAIYQERTGAAS